mgnify:CR=1 FL=1
MQEPQGRAGFPGLAAYITRCYDDADYVFARSHTPADVIRNKIVRTQKRIWS